MVAKTHIALGRVFLVFLYTGRKRQVSDPHNYCSARKKPTGEVAKDGSCLLDFLLPSHSIVLRRVLG